MTSTSDHTGGRPRAGAAGRRRPPPLRTLLVLAALAASLSLPACRERQDVLRDGYYSAEARDYDRDGWKDYLTIYVNNGQITIAEYDSRNLSGFRRSWDLDHVLEWSRRHGVRPGSVMISYQNSLLTLQDPSRVQPIPGGRNMYLSFTSLAAAAIEQSRNGERQVAYVALPEREYPDEL